MMIEGVPKFFCPVCGRKTDSRVLDSDPDESPDCALGRIRRRRECVECGDTFPTDERPARRRKPPRRRLTGHEPPELPFG